MENCILCGKETQGSVGAAGLHWKKICQPCKDQEDDLLGMKIKAQAQACKFLTESLLGAK